MKYKDLKVGDLFVNKNFDEFWIVLKEMPLYVEFNIKTYKVCHFGKSVADVEPIWHIYRNGKRIY